MTALLLSLVALVVAGGLLALDCRRHRLCVDSYQEVIDRLNDQIAECQAVRTR